MGGQGRYIHQKESTQVICMYTRQYRLIQPNSVILQYLRQICTRRNLGGHNKLAISSKMMNKVHVLL